MGIDTNVTNHSNTVQGVDYNGIDQTNGNQLKGKYKGRNIANLSYSNDNSIKTTSDGRKSVKQASNYKVSLRAGVTNPTTGLKNINRRVFNEKSISEMSGNGVLRKKGNYVKVGSQANSTLLGSAARKLPVLGNKIIEKDQKRYAKEAAEAKDALNQLILNKQQEGYVVVSGWQ